MKENQGEMGPKPIANTQSESKKSPEAKVSLIDIPTEIIAEKIYDTVINNTDIIKRIENANTLDGDTIIEKIKVSINTLPETNLSIEVVSNKKNFAQEFKSLINERIDNLKLSERAYTIKELSSELLILDENDKDEDIGKRQVKNFADKAIIY